ncbi:MAG: secondary thiamine-phosphate synthase enzyme YjbQ, partial [Chitinispirillaceae bacterium]|nr:secondary thiamine-phosphate synthase enzyme YjbQ [Chitinispirillaceae bacterium]
MVYSSYISLSTSKRCCWIDITERTEKIVRESKIKNGICSVTSLHTTAGITINENADPDVEYDFFKKLGVLIPVDPQFHHSEGNSDSHIKTSLVGPSVQVSVLDGRVVLGTWQSIYFCEFDGPRTRRCIVTCLLYTS